MGLRHLRSYRASRQRSRGYVLLPVAVLIGLVATSAYLIARESSMNVELAASAMEIARVQYAAEAGFQHAKWQAQGSGCSGYTDLGPTPFQDYTYDAAVAPNSGSPITIAAKAISADGLVRTFTRDDVRLYVSNSITLQPNAIAGKDTGINFDSPNNNFGADNKHELNSDEAALYQFSLPGIPANAIISSAVLELYQEWSNAAAAKPGDIDVHRVTQAWTEGTGTGASPAFDGASWNTFDGVSNWAVSGGDYDPEPTATTYVIHEEGWHAWDIAPLVGAWINGIHPNHGVLLRTGADGADKLKYTSSDDSVTVQHPKLTITYSCECGLSCGVLNKVVFSTDTNATLGGLIFDPIDLAEYDSSIDAASLFFDGSLTTLIPEIDAVHALSNGHILLSTGADAKLGNVIFGPADLIDYDPFTDTAAMIFDGGALFSNNENIDAVYFQNNGHLILSTDTSATLGGLTFQDNDLVDYDPVANTASLFFDGALFTLGSADIDAVHVLGDGHIVLSPAADGTELGGLTFDNDDLVDYDPVANTASLFFHGNTRFADPGENVISAHVGVASGVTSCRGAFVDHFDAAAYNNNDGSRLWSGDWFELDAGAGPGAGQVKIFNNEIRLIGPVLAGDSPSLARQAHLSGYSYANLSFGFATGTGVDAAEDSAVVEISSNGGLGWVVLEDFVDEGPSATGTRNYDIGAYIAADTQVRFRINSNYDGADEFFYVDDVVITASCDPPPGRLLLVVVNPSSLTAQESAKKSLIESWGYTVSLIDVNSNQATFNTAVSNNDVVYITEDVDSNNMGTKLTDAIIGVVTEEDNLSDEFGMASAIDWDTAATDISIDDNSHYITEPFSLGTLTLFTAPESLAYVTGTLSPDLLLLGSSISGPGLVALEQGTALYGGGFAAGRRAQLPWGGNDFDLNNLTDDGKTIMRRAIEWGSIIPQRLLLVVPDAASLSTQDTAKKALFESWNYVVLLISETDSQTEFDDAAAISHVVYISEEALSTNVGTKLRDATIGVVLEEPALTDEFGLSSTRATVSSSAIVVTNRAHYITQPFTTGSLTVATSNQELNHLTGTLAPDLESLAQISLLPSLVVIEQGGTLFDLGIAAGRRAQLPWGGLNFNINSLNTDGETILRRTLEWGAGAGVTGGPCEGVFRDEFNVNGYSNHDGTLAWATDWLEIGEADGPLAGDARVAFDVSSYQLAVENQDIGVQRELDLTGAVTATLTYDYRRNSLDAGNEKVAVEVSANGAAGPWNSVATYQGPNNDAGYLSNSHDISTYISPNTRIRFLSNNKVDSGEGVWFENVQIQCAP